MDEHEYDPARFQAVEEALANAVYHKSYEEREPIKVNIWADKMEIISHGGAMPPINVTIKLGP